MLLSRTNRSFQLSAVAVALWTLSMVQTGYATSLPFMEDFSGTAPDFTNTAAAGAVWAVNPGGAGVLRLTQTAQASSQANSSSVSIPTGLGAGSLAPTDYFLISSTINVSAYTTSGANGVDIGLNLFGDDSALTNAYRLDFNPTKQSFRISGTDTTPTGAFTFNALETYALTVKGWYTSGTLNLEFTLSDPSQSPVTISAVDTTPLAGTFFGFRNRTGASTSNNNSVINHDDFSASVVPEPTSVSLVVVAGLCGLMLFRKVTPALDNLS
jgi:hypothetical protein